MTLDCGHEPSDHFSKTTGYGTDKDGKTYCYACCAERDKEAMRTTGRITLYLDTNKITNWPGSLVFKPTCVKRGRHNIAGTRYDAWFTFEGHQWHGVQYGENTQLLHCKRIK